MAGQWKKANIKKPALDSINAGRDWNRLPDLWKWERSASSCDGATYLDSTRLVSLLFADCLLASHAQKGRGKKDQPLSCRICLSAIYFSFSDCKIHFFFLVLHIIASVHVRLWLAGAPAGGRTSELLCWMEGSFTAAQLQESKESLCHFSTGS